MLLHTCCAPCATYPAKFFKENGIDFTAFFMNPNIHPLSEQVRRGEALWMLADREKFGLIYSNEFDQDAWEGAIGESSDRCKLCYEIRLYETARQAKLRGFEGFSTTLLISPYQDHDLIKQIGFEAAEMLGLTFYYEDFRPHFREGQALAREMGIYMQKYCGCVVSLAGKGR